MEKTLVKVAFAEDHTAFRVSLAAFLNDMGGVHFNLLAANGRDLLDKLKVAETLPDVCIIDISMPEMDGFETILELKKRYPDLKVLVLTMFFVELYVIRMIASGANGYLLKNSDPQEIKHAIEQIHESGFYHHDKMTLQFFKAVLTGQHRLPSITEKERLLLKFACTDLNYAAIAVEMRTTERSVMGYRDSLFRKLNVNSRTAMALFALRYGLVPMEFTTGII